MVLEPIRYKIKMSSKVGFIPKLLILACRWPLSHRMLTCPLLSVCAWREKARFISSYGSTNAIRPGTHLHDLIKPRLPRKGPISKYHHIGG